MVLVPINPWAGAVVYLLAIIGISLLGVKLSAVVAEKVFVFAQPYLDKGPPKLSRIEQRRIDATLAVPPLPQGERRRIAALETPALPVNVLATRLDFAEREELTEPTSTHIASNADALEPSSQPSSIATRVYGYTAIKLRSVQSSSRYAAVSARDVFNRSFGVLTVADQ